MEFGTFFSVKSVNLKSSGIFISMLFDKNSYKFLSEDDPGLKIFSFIFDLFFFEKKGYKIHTKVISLSFIF